MLIHPTLGAKPPVVVLLQLSYNRRKILIHPLRKINREVHVIVMRRDGRRRAVGTGRFLGRVRPADPVIAFGLDGLLGPVLPAPGRATCAFGCCLPVGGVDFGAGFEDSVARARICVGCCVAPGEVSNTGKR